MYLAVSTRSDLSVAASKLGANLKHPMVKHVTNAKSVLQYLRGSADKEMMLRLGKDNQLSGYVDVSWGSSQESNQEIRSGMISLYGDAVIYASSYTQ